MAARDSHLWSRGDSVDWFEVALQLCRGLSSNDELLHVFPPVDESNCEIRAEPTSLGAKLAIRRTIRVGDDLEGASKGAISYSSSGGHASGP